MYKKSRLVRVRGPDGRYAFGIAGEAEVVSARGLVCCQIFYWLMQFLDNRLFFFCKPKVCKLIDIYSENLFYCN